MTIKMPTLLRITIYIAGIAFVIVGLLNFMNGVQALSALTPLQKAGILLVFGIFLIILSHRR